MFRNVVLDYYFPVLPGERVALRKSLRENFDERLCNCCWLKFIVNSFPRFPRTVQCSRNWIIKHKNIPSMFRPFELMCASRASILAFTIFSSSSLRQTFFMSFRLTRQLQRQQNEHKRDCWQVCDERATWAANRVWQSDLRTESEDRWEFWISCMFCSLRYWNGRCLKSRRVMNALN